MKRRPKRNNWRKNLADNRIPSTEQTTEQKFIRLQELRKKQRLFELKRKESGIGDFEVDNPELDINLDPSQATVPTPELLNAPEESELPIGAIIGGTIGTIAGLPAGPGGVAFGTTIGSAGGEAVEQIIQQLTEDPNAPQTPEEALRRIGQEGVFGLIGEGIAQPIVRGFRGAKDFLTGPFSKGLTLEDKVAAEAFEKLGIQPTPFEVTQRTFLGRIQEFASKGLISGGIMKRFNNSRLNLLKQFQQRFLAKTGPKKLMSDLGKFAKSSFDDTVEILDKEAGRLFIKAQTQAGEENIIPTTAFKAAADTVLSQEGRVTKGLQFRALQKLADEIKKLPEKISYLDAREFQKRLGAKVAQLKNLPEGESKQLFKGISDSIEGAEFTGKGQGSEALATLRQAKDRFIEMLNLQKSTLGKRVTSKDPEDIFRSIFQTGDVTNIKALRSVVGEQDWPMFQRAFADDLMHKGNLDNFHQVLEKQQLESLQEVFNNEQIQVLHDIAAASQRFRPGALGEAQRTPLGFNLVNITQGGIAVNLALGDRGFGGGAIKKRSYLLDSCYDCLPYNL